MSIQKKKIFLISIVICFCILSFVSNIQSEPSFSGNSILISDITTIDFTNTEVLAGTRYDGIYAVDFTQEEYTYLTTGLNFLYPVNYTVINDIAVNSQNGLDFYAAPNHGFTLGSTNAGSSWYYEATLPTTASILSLAIHPNGSKLFAGTDRGLYISNDSGVTWTVVDGGTWRMSINCVVIDPADSQNIYAGGWYHNMIDLGRVYYSDDGGSTWSYTEMPCPIDKITIDPGDNSVVYALNSRIGTTAGDCPLISTDYGQNFDYFSPDITDRYVYDVAVTNTSVVYAATDQGIYRFNSQQGTWINTEITEDEVTILEIISTTLYYVTDTALAWHSLS